MLSPGAKAPVLPKAGAAGRRTVLIFLPAEPTEELLAGLGRFGEQALAFADQGADVVVVAPAVAAEPGPFTWLADNEAALARAFGVDTPPSVFTLDESGIIRSVYDAERYPSLPNPAAVARGLRKLNDAPRPAAVEAADWRLGPDDAPVTLIEYSDYQCGRCQVLHAAMEPVFHDLARDMQMVHRHLPLRTTHPLAQLAAEAAEAAGAQGKFWEMHHRLFAAANALERAELIGYAAELGLDVARFTAELDGRVYQEAVNEDFRRAVAGNIKLPPTLFINGVLYDGSLNESELRARLAPLAGGQERR